MLNKTEFEELKFFADKVANVHGPKHNEFIKIGNIVKNIDEKNIIKKDLDKLKKLTNNYLIPKWACNAQTKLINLLKKLEI